MSSSSKITHTNIILYSAGVASLVTLTLTSLLTRKKKQQPKILSKIEECDKNSDESKVFYDQGMSHDLALPYNSILTLEKQIEALIVTLVVDPTYAYVPPIQMLV